ncbi:hypothetical protein V8C35DRAFT_313866 [Trichoderma chlorosporum]
MHRVVETRDSSCTGLQNPCHRMRVCRVRACICTPRYLNGPFIAQPPVKSPEPNAVGKLEGEHDVPPCWNDFLQQGKGEAGISVPADWSDPVLEAVGDAAPLAFEPGIGRKKWTHACT